VLSTSLNRPRMDGSRLGSKLFAARDNQGIADRLSGGITSVLTANTYFGIAEV